MVDCLMRGFAVCSVGVVVFERVVSGEELVGVLLEVFGGSGDVGSRGASVIDATEGVLGTFLEMVVRVSDVGDEGTKVADLLEHGFVRSVGGFGSIMFKKTGRGIWR